MYQRKNKLIQSPAKMPERLTNLVNRRGRTIHCIQFDEGLNPAQWDALRYLQRANKYSRTPSGLAGYLHTTKGTASQTLKSLESKGLIERVPHDKDRRGVLLDVTDRGRELLMRDPLIQLEGAAGALGDDLGQAHDILARLARGMEEAANVNGYGVCKECTLFCKNAIKPNGDGGTKGPHQCGLTKDPLSETDSTKICVNFRN